MTQPIWILGASGYVGGAYQRLLEKRGVPFRTVPRSDLDYYDVEALTAALRDAKPEFVVNCAGYTGKPNVDACELHKTECLNGNAILPGILREACEATGLKPNVETPNSGLPRIKLERGPLRAPTVVDGPVLIRAQRLVRSASVSYANGTQEQDAVRLSFAVLLEPKLRKNVWIGAAQIEKAVDENEVVRAFPRNGVGANVSYLEV